MQLAVSRFEEGLLIRIERDELREEGTRWMLVDTSCVGSGLGSGVGCR